MLEREREREEERKRKEAKPCLIYDENVKTETIPVKAHEVQTEIGCVGT